ncbi:unnamed protein product [Ectocarpus sp. 13 AM-2016]
MVGVAAGTAEGGGRMAGAMSGVDGGGGGPGGPSGLPHNFLVDHVSPATRLLEKRRQMFEIQEALEAQKEEFSRREDAFRRREDALRKKDLELQESLIKFNKFLQENESKRNRAVKRAGDERKQREQKEQEIIKLRKQCRERQDEETRLKRDLEEHRRYHDFLAQVVEAATEDYSEVQDLLKRFATLKDANKNLNEAQARDEGETERLRSEFSNYTKERTNEILNESNEIAGMQKLLEMTGREVLLLQNELDNKISNMSDRTLEMGQVLGAVANILDRCVGARAKRGVGGGTSKAVEVRAPNGKSGPVSKSGPKKLEDLEAEGKLAMDRLEDIANYMGDYRDIVDEYADLHRVHKRLEGATPQTTGGGAPLAAIAATAEAKAAVAAPPVDAKI